MLVAQEKQKKNYTQLNKKNSIRTSNQSSSISNWDRSRPNSSGSSNNVLTTTTTERKKHDHKWAAFVWAHKSVKSWQDVGCVVEPAHCLFSKL